MAITEIAAALAAVKTAKDMAKGLAALQADVAVKEKSQELYGIILDLMGSISEIRIELESLREENVDLKKELAEIGQWTDEKTKYQLAELTTGVFVYRYQPSGEAVDQLEHMLCANCYDRDKKSILQLSRRVVDGDFYICHNCDSEICDHSKKRKKKGRSVVSQGLTRC